LTKDDKVKDHTYSKMISHNRPAMHAPVEDIIEGLITKKVAIRRKNNKRNVNGTSLRSLTSLDDDEIVKRFNSMISGLLNYYSFVNFKSKL
jgi:uncharacterized iron-regulated protein